jgi:hypothetical protein
MVPLEKSGAGSDFMQQFEKYKCIYQGPTMDSEVYLLPIKLKVDERDALSTEWYNIEDREVRVTG